ncbi:carbohydrate ABC transporter permease [Paenibacillus eucommiae]|uniref:Raffinose/stachyose/melibiose transport system permease protein n=1 Tax=Paenibacillus eucommiae TaxID=1355755 RepID=A0ABS4J3V2_9BACL|nr:carbohydrate ABC transporter permease [Paenibacillus eucommiae]MBP1994521.1 raffinose/stachyose/melibiose transport system permease protein [Paenibacillus eucommiae]
MTSFHNKAKMILLELLVVLSSLIIVFPLLMMIFGSLKTPMEAAQFNIKLPTEWKFDNYSFVFHAGGIMRAFYNSVIITSFATLATVVMSSAAAFVIARRNTRLTEMMYIFFLIGIIAPMQIVTTYALLKALGLMGSFLGVILVNAAINVPFSIFLYCGFIKSIPRDLDEAAAIDGCGSYRLFARIILPLLLPVVASNVIFLVLGIWNDIMLPLYFLSGTKWPLPLMVYKFFGQYFSNWNYVFADLIISAIPVVVLFLTAQKYIVSGVVAGAVKG